MANVPQSHPDPRVAAFAAEAARRGDKRPIAGKDLAAWLVWLFEADRLTAGWPASNRDGDFFYPPNGSRTRLIKLNDAWRCVALAQEMGFLDVEWRASRRPSCRPDGDKVGAHAWMRVDYARFSEAV